MKYIIIIIGISLATIVSGAGMTKSSLIEDDYKSSKPAVKSKTMKKANYERYTNIVKRRAHTRKVQKSHRTCVSTVPKKDPALKNTRR